MPSNMNDAIEWIAVFCGLISVIGNIKMLRWAWLIQIVSSVLYCYVFWVQKLYGLAALQWYFIAIAGWAFWTWQSSAKANAIHIQSLRLQNIFLVIGIWLVATAAMAFGLAYWTNSEAAFVDAFATTGSIIAQWLMSRYLIQTWPIWAIVNGVSVWLFASTGLWPSAGLYGLFVVMAVLGFAEWNKLRNQKG